MKPTLDDLCPLFRPAAEAVIAQLESHGYRIVLVTALRTVLEEREKIEQGRSQTLNSHHLAQVRCPTCGTMQNSEGTVGLAHALDIAPLSADGTIDWNPAHSAWIAIGEAVQDQKSLLWGGSWHTLVDDSHLQLDGLYLGPEQTVSA